MTTNLNSNLPSDASLRIAFAALGTDIDSNFDVARFTDRLNSALTSRAPIPASYKPRLIRRRQIIAPFIAISLGVTPVIALANASVRNWFRIGGVEIERVTPTQSSKPSPERAKPPRVPTFQPTVAEPTVSNPRATEPWPGEPVTVAEAARRAGRTIALPKALRDPRTAYWFSSGAVESVVLVWSPSSALPKTADPKIGLILMSFPSKGIVTSGGRDAAVAKKVLQDTRVDAVTINGREGVFLSGPSHTVLFRDGSGAVVVDSTRVAGNTLIWTDGNLTYRMESALSLKSAVAIAKSVRFPKGTKR